MLLGMHRSQSYRLIAARVVSRSTCTCTRGEGLNYRSFPLEVFSWRRIAFDRQERCLRVPTYNGASMTPDDRQDRLWSRNLE